LRLLRQIIAAPDKTVGQLAEEAEIGLSRASQELRRLQSRGLVGVEREGPFVRYRPEPDPLVSSARPILAALRGAFARSGRAPDRQIVRLATALAHPRRILVYRELLDGPRTVPMLRDRLRIPCAALFRHLRLLQEGGLVHATQGVYRRARNGHPLAKCLTGLVQPAP